MYSTDQINPLHQNISCNEFRALAEANVKRMKFIQNETERMGREYERCLEMHKFYRVRLTYVG